MGDRAGALIEEPTPIYEELAELFAHILRDDSEDSGKHRSPLD
ncbi:hypothetical protein AB5J62_32400 [Amycolatopsis sp. cg5]